MQGTKVDPRSTTHALALAFLVALPTQAWSARPAGKDGAARQVASQPVPGHTPAKHMTKKSPTRKAGPASGDTAQQPYQELVSDVSDSLDAFREDNTSDNGERDRLEEPPWD